MSDRLRRAAAVIRRVIGAPDYERYLAHHARAHPDVEPMSRETFDRARIEDRYNKPGSRCC